MELRPRKQAVDTSIDELNNKLFQVVGNTHDKYQLKYILIGSEEGYYVTKVGGKNRAFWEKQNVINNIFDSTWIIIN